VVGLDRGRGSLEGNGLDHVGVECALEEELGVAKLLSLDLKDLDKGVANDLSLLFGVGNALELAQEELAGIDDGEVDVELLLELVESLVGLVQAEESVVDEDGMESAGKRQRRVNKNIPYT